MATGFRRWVILGFALTAVLPVRAEGPSQITISRLLADGWEVAGYSASFTTTLGSIILFKHKDRGYFVQCSALYDATRSARTAERVVTNCYELR